MDFETVVILRGGPRDGDGRPFVVEVRHLKVAREVEHVGAARTAEILGACHPLEFNPG
ncbi:hypothetical protein LL946_04820 [Knoellia locipacati]|uniref:hypothetical protein n=1 Tax=Knoellia locipacati TaxID=882824 RepID=UPI00384DFF49